MAKDPLRHSCIQNLIWITPKISSKIHFWIKFYLFNNNTYSTYFDQNSKQSCRLIWGLKDLYWIVCMWEKNMCMNKTTAWQCWGFIQSYSSDLDSTLTARFTLLFKRMTRTCWTDERWKGFSPSFHFSGSWVLSDSRAALTSLYHSPPASR